MLLSLASSFVSDNNLHLYFLFHNLNPSVMKKIFGIICLSLLITMSISSPLFAQVDYSFAVVWFDINCDGGSVLEKELYWEVYYLGETPPN